MPSSTSDRQFGDAKAAAAERRRTNKPIMEKKRRQRINDSLNQLKILVLEALKKDPSRYNKLEKADILEMTVRHVQNLHRQPQHTPAPCPTPVDPAAKYLAGFSHCVSEVNKFLERDTSLTGGQRSRILLHLSESLTSIRTGASPASSPSPQPQPSSEVVPAASSPRANTPLVEATYHRHQQLTPLSDPLVMRGVSLVPAHLLTGQMAYILPHGVVSTTVANTVATSAPAGDYHQVPLSPPPSVPSPSLSFSSSPPASPCRSPSPQPLDLAPIRHPEDDCCWRPW
ncbi:transcription factor HES-2-like [Macrobrachium rosenbergii]|uniref:transcription factor HES-2-like n=1 Tax=Macrobrachium rosenbergii TaxID=79674 RepID=UPI0034D79CF6